MISLLQIVHKVCLPIVRVFKGAFFTILFGYFQRNAIKSSYKSDCFSYFIFKLCLLEITAVRLHLDRIYSGTGWVGLTCVGFTRSR